MYLKQSNKKVSNSRLRTSTLFSVTLSAATFRIPAFFHDVLYVRSDVPLTEQPMGHSLGFHI